LVVGDPFSSQDVLDRLGCGSSISISPSTVVALSVNPAFDRGQGWLGEYRTDQGSKGSIDGMKIGVQVGVKVEVKVGVTIGVKAGRGKSEIGSEGRSEYGSNVGIECKWWSDYKFTYGSRTNIDRSPDIPGSWRHR
jgi:hypothetical protein